VIKISLFITNMLLSIWSTNTNRSYRIFHCCHIWFQRELTQDQEFLKLESWKGIKTQNQPFKEVKVTVWMHLS